MNRRSCGAVQPAGGSGAWLFGRGPPSVDAEDGDGTNAIVAPFVAEDVVAVRSVPSFAPAAAGASGSGEWAGAASSSSTGTTGGAASAGVDVAEPATGHEGDTPFAAGAGRA